MYSRILDLDVLPIDSDPMKSIHAREQHFIDISSGINTYHQIPAQDLLLHHLQRHHPVWLSLKANGKNTEASFRTKKKEHVDQRIYNYMWAPWTRSSKRQRWKFWINWFCSKIKKADLWNIKMDHFSVLVCFRVHGVSYKGICTRTSTYVVGSEIEPKVVFWENNHSAIPSSSVTSSPLHSLCSRRNRKTSFQDGNSYWHFISYWFLPLHNSCIHP